MAKRKKRTRYCKDCQTAVLNPKNKSGLCKDCIRNKPKDGAGRPTKFTKELINKLEQAFSLGCSDNEACLHADISPTALYKYQLKNPEFVERKEVLKDKLLLKARSNVAKDLQEGNTSVSLWYLERKKKDEFSQKHEVENSGEMIVNWHETKNYGTK